jgi:metallophosphoesterase superfamily enzyme
LDEDRYFADTAQCLEWFVADAIRASVDFFVVNGDLTTYKATITERNLWVDKLVEMANHAPVILVAGNHGAELEGDLYVFGRAKASTSAPSMRSAVSSTTTAMVPSTS